MASEAFKRVLIILMLGLLTASAFFVRLENFKNSRLRSIDEIVYFRMGTQVLREGLSGYHTIPYGQELAAAGRPLPEYFFQPLFKHPPLFTFLIALSMKIFGANMIAAEYVSLLFGVLMVPLIYLLGACIYGRRVGILAALFLWIDPINIICSQKVWMDSTIAFFTLLAALAFILGFKRGNDWLFIVSGVAGGLALNTKYTGVFVTFAIALFCVLYRRSLFANKKFRFSLLLPLIMLGPWLYWNYRIYGIGSILSHSELKSVYARLSVYMPVFAALTVAVLFLYLIFLKRRKKNILDDKFTFQDGNRGPVRVLGFLFPIVFFVLIIPKQFLHSLQFTHLPTHSWQMGTFADALPSFYFGRLVEYSFIYVLSFFSVFRYHPSEKKEAPFIRLCALTILLFFVFWGNYQSRYILPSLPFLIVLGVQLWVSAHEQVSQSGNMVVRLGGKTFLKFILVYAVLKTYYLDLVLSYPNDMCYF